MNLLPFSSVLCSVKKESRQVYIPLIFPIFPGIGLSFICRTFKLSELNFSVSEPNGISNVIHVLMSRKQLTTIDRGSASTI